MDAKRLFWAALRHFKERNAHVLPQMQLQYGANERWFAREFTAAMNRHLSGTWSPARLRRYADCEFRYHDISVWDGTDPIAVYEVKVLYSGMRKDLLFAISHKARTQLVAHRRLSADRSIGLFFSVYFERVTKRSPFSRAVNKRAFKDNVRDAVREHFRSDHSIRMTALSGPTDIEYGPPSIAEVWHTESWITWGMPL